jgi:hypothetical protein
MKRIIALSLLLPTTLLAQEPGSTSYDWFDVNYLATNWDFGAVDVDGNGYSGRFSVALREHLFMTGDYSSWDFDDISGGSTSTTLGLGTNWDLSDRFSVYGAAGFRSIDLDLGAGNLEEETGFIAGGVRWQVANGYELRFGADYADLSPVRANEASVTIGGDIFITDTLALSLELNEHDDDETTFLIGIRFYHRNEASSLRQRR